MKKNVKFFFYNSHRIGYNTYESFKYLFKYGINCHLVKWDEIYTLEEMSDMDSCTDLWVTTPNGANVLIDDYRISPSKCVVILYSVSDCNDLRISNITDYYNFACVSQQILEFFCSNYSDKLVPKLCNIGINTDIFDGYPPRTIKNIGYFNDITSNDPEIRFPVAQKCAEILELPIYTFQNNNYSFSFTPYFYKKIGCIVVPSFVNIDPFSLKEASVSGTLIIGVDDEEHIVSSCGGIVVDSEEKKFIEQTIEIVNYFKNNTVMYREKCLQIRNNCKNFDWNYTITQWVEILE